MRRVTEVWACLLLVLLVAATPVLAGEAANPVRRFLNLDLMLAQTGPGQAPAVPPSGVLPLSIRDSIALALKNNLDIAIEGFNPPQREQDLINQKAVFDPSAFLELTQSDNRTPLGVQIVQGSRLASEFSDYNAGLRQMLPTGGTYELRFNNEYDDLHSVPFTGFISKFGLTLTQPLLKNFGFEPTETNIRIATNNQSISLEQLRLKVSDIVTNVQNDYAELIFAIQNLEVQRRSLQLAKDLVALNTARVRAGVAAPVEVTQAEAQEAAGVQNVILAEKAVRDAEDTLKVILNLPASGGWGQEIQLSDALTFEPKSANLDESLQKALENRYEYKSAKLDIQNKELNVRLTRNQLLPDLAFTGSVFTNGAGNTYGSNISEMGSTHFMSYSVGVVLTVPLGNRGPQASYINAKLAQDQAKTSLKNLELQIIQQVREAVRRVDANARRVDANRAARVLAEEQLRVEQRRLEAGVSTTFNVVSFQRDLTAAQANEIRAIADYYEALVNLDHVRGTVLEANHIEM
ncbi:MAG: TolC family protein [Candidatus Methylomirabilales bacterium]